MTTDDLSLVLLRHLDDPRDIMRLCLASHGTEEACRRYLTNNMLVQAGRGTVVVHRSADLCRQLHTRKQLFWHGQRCPVNWLEHWEACRSAVAWILDVCGKEALVQHIPVMKIANAAVSSTVAIAPKLSATVAQYFVAAGYRVQVVSAAK